MIIYYLQGKIFKEEKKSAPGVLWRIYLCSIKLMASSLSLVINHITNVAQFKNNVLQ